MSFLNNYELCDKSNSEDYQEYINKALSIISNIDKIYCELSDKVYDLYSLMDYRYENNTYDFVEEYEFFSNYKGAPSDVMEAIYDDLI